MDSTPKEKESPATKQFIQINLNESFHSLTLIIPAFFSITFESYVLSALGKEVGK
jgi:hypothetical protein